MAILTPHYFAPAYGLPACIIVDVGNDSFQFTIKSNSKSVRTQYGYAHLFCRLIERGYEPTKAYKLAHNWGIAPTRKTFELMFDEGAHAPNIPVPFIPETCVSAEDVMFTDELTPAERETLYQMWLKDGDEIFHFESNYFDDINIPALLYDFRALAQSQDELTGDYTHSHHSDVVQY